MAEKDPPGQEENDDEKTLSQFLVECQQEDKLHKQLNENRKSSNQMHYFLLFDF
jgi:hypothetical protein